jgi:hypothetical protein
MMWHIHYYFEHFTSSEFTKITTCYKQFLFQSSGEHGKKGNLTLWAPRKSYSQTMKSSSTTEPNTVNLFLYSVHVKKKIHSCFQTWSF